MVYDSGSVGSDDDGESDRSGRMDGSDCCSESADPVLDSLPNSYSKLDVFLYKS